MQFQPDTTYIGVDLSNWQGTITDEQLDAIVAAGATYAIVRLDCDLPNTQNLTLEQCNRLRYVGLPVMGYCWAYFSDLARSLDEAYAQQAAALGIDIVAVDIEDNVPPGRPWYKDVSRYTTALTKCGIMTLGYTYTWWPTNQHVSLSSVSFDRWWIGNENGIPDVSDWYAPEGVRDIIGHQYGSLAAAGISVDLNAFRFDAEMCARLNAQMGETMTEDDVRRIFAEEMAKLSTACNAGTDFTALMQALITRMGAAGRALDLTQPVPPWPPAGG